MSSNRQRNREIDDQNHHIPDPVPDDVEDQAPHIPVPVHNDLDDQDLHILVPVHNVPATVPSLPSTSHSSSVSSPSVPGPSGTHVNSFLSVNCMNESDDEAINYNLHLSSDDDIDSDEIDDSLLNTIPSAPAALPNPIPAAQGAPMHHRPKPTHHAALLACREEGCNYFRSDN